MEGSAQAPPSYASIIQQIWRDDGLGGFFKGLSASYVGCIEGGVQWVVYEQLKQRVTKFKEETSNTVITPLETFLSAATAKCIAIILTYPHEVVRIRLREAATAGASYKYKNFVGALRTIAQEEGQRGLYGGMGIHLARSVPNAAIMFLAFEISSKWLMDSVSDNDKS